MAFDAIARAAGGALLFRMMPTSVLIASPVCFLPVIGKAALQASWQLAITDKTNGIQTFWFDSARKYLCGSKLPPTDV
jgi:hypothetical protein